MRGTYVYLLCRLVLGSQYSISTNGPEHDVGIEAKAKEQGAEEDGVVLDIPSATGEERARVVPGLMALSHADTVRPLERDQGHESGRVLWGVQQPLRADGTHEAAHGPVAAGLVRREEAGPPLIDERINVRVLGPPSPRVQHKGSRPIRGVLRRLVHGLLDLLTGERQLNLGLGIAASLQLHAEVKDATGPLQHTVRPCGNQFHGKDAVMQQRVPPVETRSRDQLPARTPMPRHLPRDVQVEHRGRGVQGRRIRDLVPSGADPPVQ
eukprot:scaffold797_cov236-Pinguiococcus_pyrenoidosus.AAC.11